MKETFNKFVALVHSGKLSQDGKTPDTVEVNDPTNLNQCMDLAYAFCDTLGVTRDTIRHLYASQVYTEPFDITVKYFELVPNTPAGVPQVGDIVVFSKDIGGVAGHISIANGDGDTNSFKSFDQNFGTDKHCRIVSHNYSAVLGWLRLRVQEMDDDTKRAISLLNQYKAANGLGNLESSVRALVGLADDTVKIKNELLEWKNGENERLKSAIEVAITENDKKWQSQMNIANNSITNLTQQVDTLTTTQAENLPWSLLFSIAWKKWRNSKKAGE